MGIKLIGKICIVTLYIVGIAAFSALAILIASGYRINYSTGRIYKVSIVRFVSDPVAEIEINGQKTAYKTPNAIYLVPGNYNFYLKKDGYTPINMYVTLGSGSLYELKDITLFKSNLTPNIQEITNPNPSEQIDSSLLTPNSNLFIAFDHEIWAKDKLVTRLASNIKSAAYYTNNSYIIYQTDTFVGVVRIDGTNNQKLFNYTSDYQLHFNFKNRGQTLEASDYKNTISATIN